MGFWGDLLGDIEAVGGVVAAPFTGGASLSLVPMGIKTIANANSDSGSSTTNDGASIPGYTDPTTGIWYGDDGSVWDPNTDTWTDGNTGQSTVVDGSTSQGQSTLSQIAKLIGQNAAIIGRSVGAAAQAAGNNRLNQEQLALQQENLNLQGQNDYESQLMKRAAQESSLRQTDLSNVITGNRILNPRVSPFDPTGGPKYSPEATSTAQNISTQGAADLASPSLYGPSSWTTLNQFQPIDLSKVQQATGTTPSTGETIANGAASVLPWLSLLNPYPTPYTGPANRYTTMGG